MITRLIEATKNLLANSDKLTPELLEVTNAVKVLADHAGVLTQEVKDDIKKLISQIEGKNEANIVQDKSSLGQLSTGIALTKIENPPQAT